MPDRVIRDEILTSPRYWGCSPKARNLWLGIALSADDAARYAGTSFALRVRCMGGTVTDEEAEELLQELVAVDLVRPYLVGGIRYLYVPRFGQRKRYVSASKYPPPPKQIIDMAEEKTDSSQTQDRPESDRSQTQDRRSGVEVGVGVGVGVEEKRREKTAVDVRPTVDARASLRSTASDRQSSTHKTATDAEEARRLIAALHEQLKTKAPLKPMLPAPSVNDEPTSKQIKAREAEKRRQLAAVKAATQGKTAPPPPVPDPPAPPPKPKAPKPKPNGTAAWNPATDAEVLAEAHKRGVGFPAGATYADIKALVRAHMKAHP